MRQLAFEVAGKGKETIQAPTTSSQAHKIKEVSEKEHDDEMSDAAENPMRSLLSTQAGSRSARDALIARPKAESSSTHGPIQKVDQDRNATPSGEKNANVTGENNNTGLPDNLKTGIESLSGISLDDVKVHYNSDKPAKVRALAYTQGAEIHVGPGQEKHLPHEAWHVVQQKQGRVRPTIQLKGEAVNDEKGLEREADEMGSKSLNVNNIEQTYAQREKNPPSQSFHASSITTHTIQRIKWDQAALAAAAAAIKNKNLSPSMIAQGYEPILDEEDKDALKALREIGNLLRYKEQIDGIPEAKKTVDQALGYIAYFDPTNVTGTLSKLSKAYTLLQQAYKMYEEHKSGTAKALTDTSQKGYGT